MNKQLLAAALVSAITLISGPAMSQQRAVKQPAKPQAATVSDKATRHALIYKIVREWGPYVNEIYKEDIRLWADRMVPTLRQADTFKLKAAARANTFEEMNNALLGQKSEFSAATAAGMVAKSLGSTVNDLTYTALASCVLVDTRSAGGAFAAGVTRHFKASGANFAAQGGSNTNCGIPTTPVSLVLSVSAITPTAHGYFRMWPYSTPEPVASNISYRIGENIQNDIILKMSQGLTQDFSVKSSGASHLVVNVLGYFAAPFATELECQTITSAPTTINPLTFADATAQCPGTIFGGFWANTGGGCAVSLSQDGKITRSEPVNTRDWNCRGYNSGAGTISVTATARCCRTPGRSTGLIIIP